MSRSVQYVLLPENDGAQEETFKWIEKLKIPETFLSRLHFFC